MQDEDLAKLPTAVEGLQQAVDRANEQLRQLRALQPAALRCGGTLRAVAWALPAAQAVSCCGRLGEQLAVWLRETLLLSVRPALEPRPVRLSVSLPPCRHDNLLRRDIPDLQRRIAALEEQMKAQQQSLADTVDSVAGAEAELAVSEGELAG